MFANILYFLIIENNNNNNNKFYDERVKPVHNFSKRDFTPLANKPCIRILADYILFLIFYFFNHPHTITEN
jgi:hypothetical protein